MGNGASLVDYDPNEAKDDTELDLNPINYPNFGNYTFDDPPLAELAQQPQAEQMRFSDAICRRYALNPRFLQMQREACASLDYRQKSQLNPTSIGNAAFIAHWNPNSAFWQGQYAAICQAFQ